LCFLQAIAKKLAEYITTKVVSTIIGTGDSVAAVEKAGMADKVSHKGCLFEFDYECECMCLFVAATGKRV